MAQVDLNVNVFGVTATTHFYLHTVLLCYFPCFLFVAVVDYIYLDNESDSKVLEFFWTNFIMNIVIWWIYAVSFLFLMLCPNRVWYGCVFVAMILFRLGLITMNIIGMHFFPSETMKHYKYGRWGMFLFEWGHFATDLYFCVILVFLSFMYRPTDPPQQNQLVAMKAEEEDDEVEEMAGDEEDPKVNENRSSREEVKIHVEKSEDTPPPPMASLNNSLRSKSGKKGKIIFV